MNNDLLDLQNNLRNLLYVRPYDLPAIEAAALKLCDAVVDSNMDENLDKNDSLDEI